MLKTSVFKGKVTHHRFEPRINSFSYPLSMVLIDLDEASQLRKNFKLFSYNRFNLSSFYPRDYLGKSDSLKENIYRCIRQKTNSEFTGKVFILTQLRRLGFVFNPVSFYFCYDNGLKYIISEIENTPWRQRYAYVHKVGGASSAVFDFAKEFHVSPFMPMNIQYHWQFEVSFDSIAIFMNCYKDKKRNFYARMELKQEKSDEARLDKLAITDLFATFKIPVLIYYQAMKLWIKGTPFIEHPDPESRIGA